MSQDETPGAKAVEAAPAAAPTTVTTLAETAPNNSSEKALAEASA